MLPVLANQMGSSHLVLKRLFSLLLLVEVKVSYVQNCRVSTIIISHVIVFYFSLFGIPFGKPSLDAMLRQFLYITLKGPAIKQPGNVL